MEPTVYRLMESGERGTMSAGEWFGVEPLDCLQGAMNVTRDRNVIKLFTFGLHWT